MIKKKLKQVHNDEKGIEEEQDDDDEEEFDGQPIEQNEWEKDNPQSQLIELAATLNITQVNENLIEFFKNKNIYPYRLI